MCGLGAATRLLAIGLLNYADDEGFFLAHPALIRGELLPFESGIDHIPAMLQELVGIGYLELVTRENRTIGRVVNFRKHQLVNRPQRSKLALLVNAHGAITDDSVNAHGVISDDSVNVHGAFTAGMDQGSGNGSGNGKGMEGSGEASQDKPGGSGGAVAVGVKLESGDRPPEPAEAGTTLLPEAGSSLKVAEEDSRLSVADSKSGLAEKKEGGAALHSSWCAVKESLLEQVWKIVEPQTQGVERYMVKVGGEHVEFSKYPEGWQITAYGSPEITLAGSCMKRGYLEKLLAQMVKGCAAPKKPTVAVVGPEWPEDLPQGYRDALLPWWDHKRERREGYKATGWAALVARERQFPVTQVRASVEASMANNWAGLFTDKVPTAADVGYGFGRQKKGGGAGFRQVFEGMGEFEVPKVVKDTGAPVGWQEATGELYGEVIAWAMLGEGQQGEVRDWLAREKKEGRS